MTVDSIQGILTRSPILIHALVKRLKPARGFPMFIPPLFPAFAVIWAPFALFPTTAWTSESLVLGPGRSLELNVPRGASMVISNGLVLKAQDRGSTIRLTGRKAGTAEVRMGAQIYAVTVLTDDRFDAYERLKRALDGKLGLFLHADARGIEVRGRLLRWSDWEELAHAMKARESSYALTATIDAGVLERARFRFRELLTDAGLPELPLNFTPELVIAVPAEPADLETRVARVLGPYGVRIEKSAATLGLEPLIRVRILVAEVRTKLMSRLGIQWPAAVEAQLLPTPLIPAQGALTVGLNALEEKGLGKILASPTLLCRSGKSAQFLAGGEFPIKIANFKAQDVIWKRHGVLLKISPRADYAGRMSIAIETEVSMIDSSQTVDGVPGLLTNRIETHFDLTRSRTIALSGLIKKEWGESSGGLPGLQSIPVLGPLFGSQEFRDNKTELMVFVTPEVLGPGDSALEESP